MSSKYGRRSRVQPTPKFCYFPGELDPRWIPCPKGPNIGPLVNVAVKLVIPNFSGSRGYLYTGPCNQVGATTQWIGTLMALDNTKLQATINFECETKEWQWLLQSYSSHFPFTGSWQSDWLSYVGGQNFDTAWTRCLAPGQPLNQEAILRAYL